MPRQYQPSLLDHVEDIEDYIPGGLHPVHLGNVFNNRYKILHKLGHGGSSTIWLALDAQKQQYVSLKINRADESINSSYSELRILQKLATETTNLDHPGRKHIMTLLDHFTITGPNGKHTCLVSEVAGPSITMLNDCPGKVAGNKRVRADLAQKVAQQTVEAVQFVHSYQLCHGDITASNLLFELASINEWTEELSDGVPKAVEYSLEDIIADIGSEDQEDDEPRRCGTMLESCGKRVEGEEAVLLKDLGEMIFKWVPEERAGLEEILGHGWFEYTDSS